MRNGLIAPPEHMPAFSDNMGAHEVLAEDGGETLFERGFIAGEVRCRHKLQALPPMAGSTLTVLTPLPPRLVLGRL